MAGTVHGTLAVCRSVTQRSTNDLHPQSPAAQLPCSGATRVSGGLRYILAPYMATPPEIIERMLQLAQVGADDVVYDVGCGDGRMLIAAARLGARGVGVDIEPYWIELACAAAAAENLGQRAHFELCDALALDCRAASVVLVYLMPWSTQKVAAQLLNQCRPGTRVVSHSFAFEAIVGETRSEQLHDAAGQAHSIHLWVIGEAPLRFKGTVRQP